MMVVLGILLCNCVIFLLVMEDLVKFGVDLMHKRRSSKVFPEAVAVTSAVFMVLTCLSINSLDFR